jgi:hypothetical protein
MEEFGAREEDMDLALSREAAYRRDDEDQPMIAV